MGFHEGIGHGAAQQQDVNLRHQVLDHADLVGNFGAAENRHKWTRRIFQYPPQVLQFFLHEQAGRRLLDEFRDACGGGMRAMRRAKSIVHVNITERRQLPRKLFVVGFFFRVEAQILQQQRLARFQLANHFFSFPPNAVWGKADVASAA